MTLILRGATITTACMARGQMVTTRIWWCAAGCLLALACAPGSDVEPLPFIVTQSEFPAFEDTLQFNELDLAAFTLTVGDPDVNRPLEVRFCLRESTDAAASELLVTNPMRASSTPDHAVERQPVTCGPIGLCRLNPPTSDAWFLDAFVAAPDAYAGPIGCAVTPGRAYASGAWRFTCDKP